jgi:hypothetical protein
MRVETADEHRRGKRVVQGDVDLSALRDADQGTRYLGWFALLSEGVDAEIRPTILLGEPGGLHQFQVEIQDIVFQFACAGAVVIGECG